MPKWVWNPFEDDVTLPCVCVCFNVRGERGGDCFFFSWMSKVFGRMIIWFVEEKNILRNEF